MIHNHKSHKTIEIIKYDGVTCDLCKKHYTEAKPDGDDIDWQNEQFHSTTTQVRMRASDHYPDDWGTTGGWECHICPECFENKLVPWLKEQGADVRELEYD